MIRQLPCFIINVLHDALKKSIRSVGFQMEPEYDDGTMYIYIDVGMGDIKFSITDELMLEYEAAPDHFKRHAYQIITHFNDRDPINKFLQHSLLNRLNMYTKRITDLRCKIRGGVLNVTGLAYKAHEGRRGSIFWIEIHIDKRPFEQVSKIFHVGGKKAQGWYADLVRKHIHQGRLDTLQMMINRLIAIHDNSGKREEWKKRYPETSNYYFSSKVYRALEEEVNVILPHCYK